MVREMTLPNHALVAQIRKYAVQGKSSKEIAELTGKVPYTIWKHAHNNGIELVPNAREKRVSDPYRMNRIVPRSKKQDDELYSWVPLNFKQLDARCREYAKSLGIDRTPTVRQMNEAEQREFATIKPYRQPMIITARMVSAWI